jgi:OOP family OmpA-OmpF porin
MTLPSLALPPFAAIRLALLGLAALLLAACQAAPAPSGFSDAQKAVLAANGFVERADGWELTMAERVLFAIDESALKPDQIAAIARIGSALVTVGILTARVEGHTDATGSRAHNAKLSRARAQTVAQPLRASGMAFTDAQIIGRGEDFPVGDNRTEAGRADNRRVVIIVTP